jgi:predicted Zn-dependent protease
MELTLDKAFQKAVEAHQAGQTQEAERFYSFVLNAQPNHPDANHNMGALAISVDKIQEARAYFKIALAADPSIGNLYLIKQLIKVPKVKNLSI